MLMKLKEKKTKKIPEIQKIINCNTYIQQV